ncbi:MAG: ComEC family competence protein [Sphingobacteriales bacterium]|nr:MAG: ComEC family competence protein [Sphingobacteriales bacterium]
MKTKTTYNLQRLPLLPVLLAYIAGILLQTYLFQPDFRWTSVLVTGAGLLLFLVLVLKANRFTKYPGLNLSILLSLICCLGIQYTAFNDVRTDEQWLGKHPEQYTHFVVRLSAKPEEKARTVLLPVTVHAGFKAGNWSDLKGKIKLYVYKSDTMPELMKGDCLLIPARLVPVTHNNNPGAFNFAQQQKRAGVYFQVFLSQDQLTVLPVERKYTTTPLNARLLSQLDTYIQEPVTRSLTRATLFNEVTDMDPQMQQDYANTGISHIIAISGMHVNMLFALFMLPLLWLKDKRKLWLKYVLVVPFVWLYIALCNYPPSAVRAAVGFTLLTLTIMLKRPQNNIHLLCMNALILLIAEPMLLFHIGVQLSFLAVLSIFIFYPPIKKWYCSKYMVLNLLWDTIAVSIAVQVLVFPLVLYYFHQFPVWFLVANCLAALFSVLQMGIAVLIMITGTMQLAAVAALLGKLLVLLTTHFNRLINWLNLHSPDLSRMIPLDALDFWLLLLMVVLFAVFWLRKHLWALYTGLITAFIFLLNLFLQDLTASRQDRVIVYAGTRQSVVEHIKGKSSVLLIDSFTENSFKYAIQPARLKYRVKDSSTLPLKNTYWKLQSCGILFLQHPDSLPDAKVDYLVLSKNAQMGAEKVLGRLQPRLVILDGSFGRTAALKAAAELEAQGFSVHNTQTEGAWWYAEK